MNGQDIFELGDVLLQSGMTLHDAKLSYKTHGSLNGAKDNTIIVPTYYLGRHPDYEPMIGDGLALDPQKYLIIVLDMFCNGLSSSASNTPQPFNGPQFPKITHWDNVHCQHRLITEHFGVERIALATGFSMGGFTPEHVCAIIAIACEEPSASGHPITHWSQQGVADEAMRHGVVATISQRSVGRFFKRIGAQAASRAPLADGQAGPAV